LVIDVQENIQELQNQLMLPYKANNHEQLMSRRRKKKTIFLHLQKKYKINYTFNHQPKKCDKTKKSILSYEEKQKKTNNTNIISINFSFYFKKMKWIFWIFPIIYST